MLYFRVAGFAFGIESAKEDAMLRRMGNYMPFRIGGDTGDGIKTGNNDGLSPGERMLFTLSLDSSVEIPAGEPSAVFRYDIAGDPAVLRIYPRRYLLSIESAHGGHTFNLDCRLTRHSSAGGTKDAGKPEFEFNCDAATKGVAPPRHIVDHMLIQAFSFASADRQTLLIHASTVVYDGQAVMFLAESGTGKSTHTRLWIENIPGTSLLNDDAPALRLVDGKAVAFGTPWSGKTACYKNEEYPLAACVKIRRAPYNRMEKLNGIAAFGALLPSCLPTMQQHDDMLDAVCSTLSALMPSVPVYTLDCLPDADAARLSNSTVFQIT